MAALFSRVFTDPISNRPLLHGYHVQTEGVRFTLNAKFLETLVQAECARLDQDIPARRWHAGQMLRLLVAGKAQAAGTNIYEAQRGAEILVSAAGDPDLRQQRLHLLSFWSAANWQGGWRNSCVSGAAEAKDIHLHELSASFSSVSHSITCHHSVAGARWAPAPSKGRSQLEVTRQHGSEGLFSETANQPTATSNGSQACS